MGLPVFSGGAVAQLCARMATALATAVAMFFAVAVPTVLSAADASENVFDSIIAKAAERHAVDPLLVKAVIWNESRFNVLASGASGEVGLMQLKWGAVKDWADANERQMPSRQQVFDPYLNIEIGTWFLARAMRRWDGQSQCYTLALCEYNAGRSRAVTWHSRAGKEADVVIASAKTRRYVINVRDKYIEYSAENAAALAGNLPADAGKQSLRSVQQ